MTLETFEELNEQLKTWANNHNLDKYSDKQVMELFEKVSDLSKAINEKEYFAEMDAIGEIQITLIILCYNRGLDPIECLNDAYNGIKD